MDTIVILKSDLLQPTDYLKEDTYSVAMLSLLTVGKCYEVTFAPLLYDPKTGEAEAVRYYIIYCDDGYARKFPMNYFITLEEYRDLQLEKILL